MKTKLKSHSGASKRIQRTGTGKLVRHKAGRRHLLTGKGRDHKRRLSGKAPVSHTMRQTINQLLPNG
ncbi:MAG: 50S ribosomal protein L35 [Nitrospiraceae bacterium]|jgi:large subunit ribosomal protein L35